MRPLVALATLMLALPMTLPAGEFEWMTREFARESGARQLHIPLFGLARFAVAVVRPAGTSELKLAVFEHPNADLDHLAHFADNTLGPNWKPIVRVHEKTGETSNIYVQPDGKYLRLLIASLEKDEVVFVQVRIRPESLIKFVDEHKRNDALGEQSGRV